MNDKMKELLERQKNGDGNIVTAMVVTDLEGNGEIFMDASTDHWQVVASLLAYGVQKAMRYEANGCLLYTSPSPRDRTRSRMPSSA